ncbi:hypothetical protein [Bogoriella caseilytica]|uniref:Leucine rich repeat variant domain-containing protein n=1 Tax=Bogoriella caseilytica TaxID=56055 RepID=A0A3N2BCB1_9MICO|nr:hypothetical protein [Bogoriella caseilytica]ROR72704.1 hypothetical protein EDD31_1063 [Bogoriella caseilytica]
MAAQEELAAQAANPETPLARLHELAQHHPELRPVIAENPSTYPALLTWLGSLGDGAVDSALARRAQAGTGAQRVERRSIMSRDSGTAASAASASDAAASEPAVEDQPTQVASPVDDSPASAGDEATAVARGHSAHTPAGSASTPAAAGPPVGAAPAAWAASTPPWQPTTGSPAAATPASSLPTSAAFLSADDQEEDDAPRRGSWIPLAALAVVAAVLVGIVILQLVGGRTGDDTPPVAEEPTTDEQVDGEEETPEDEGEDEAPDDEAEPDPAEEARLALADLPETTSCDDAAGDAAVVATYGDAHSDGAEWSESGDGSLVLATLDGLESACDTAYVRDIASRLVDDGPDAVAGEIRASGAQWLEAQDPPADARELNQLASPSGNIRCDGSGDSLHCRIVSYDFTAPEGCPASTVLALNATEGAEVNCDLTTAGEAPILFPGESAVVGDGDLACETVGDDGIRCWSLITGEGFELSRSDFDLF